jgi:hypothetical protein
VFGEQLLLQEWKLHRVGDLLDLFIETSDLGVTDVRDFLEQQVLDVWTREKFKKEIRSRIETYAVSAPQPRSSQDVREFTHDLFIAATENDRTDTVFENFLHGDDLADTLGSTRCDHVQAFVEYDFSPSFEEDDVDVGMEIDAHLATRRQNVDSSIVVLPHDDPICRRGLGELLHFLAQIRDVLAGLSERGAQALVPRRFLCEQTLRLEKALLELSQSARGI